MATSDSRKRRLPRGERREQILRVAARLFAVKGYAATTTKEIAGRVGVSESALYKHFPGKEALFHEVIDSKIDTFDVERFLADLPPRLGFEEVLRSVAGRILDIGLGDPMIQKLLLVATLAESPGGDRLYRKWRAPFLAHLERRIRSGVARGEIRDVDPRITARAFVGLVMDCVQSCNLWDKLGYGEFDREKTIANNVSIFARGLLPENGRRGAGQGAEETG